MKMKKKCLTVISLVITFLALASCGSKEEIKILPYVDTVYQETSPSVEGQKQVFYTSAKNCEKVQYRVFVENKDPAKVTEITDGYSEEVRNGQNYRIFCGGEVIKNNSKLLIYVKAVGTKGSIRDDNCKYDSLKAVDIQCVKDFSKPVLKTDSEYKAIERLMNSRLEAIKMKDKVKFLNTLDKTNKEYYCEQTHWFSDIISSTNVKNYKIKFNEMRYVYENTIVAELEQSYSLGDSKKSIRFREKFIKTPDGFKDSDIFFNEIRSKHFKVLYLDKYRQVADMVLGNAESSYAAAVAAYKDEPTDMTTIKIYDDREILRQTVKLSFSWQFTGWYEINESIKMYRSTIYEDSPIQHELIHKITINQGKNNLPYWFCEGLACYYAGGDSNAQVNTHMRPLKAAIRIKKLEKMNLEKLTEGEQISEYYGASTEVVTYLIEKYGGDKVKEIIKTLGKNKFVEVSGSEADFENQKRFRAAVKEVLGIEFEDL